MRETWDVGERNLNAKIAKDAKITKGWGGSGSGSFGLVEGRGG
jgi:hypothetical protein